MDVDVFSYCLHVLCSSDAGEMGGQCGTAVRQLFIDFQEANDSEEEYGTTISLGVLYLPMKRAYIISPMGL